jgi:hypothetical protein
MSISHLARSIVESPTFALNEEARILKERGEPVINMGIGEPKNRPRSLDLKHSAKLNEGGIKYTPPDGLPSLKSNHRYTEEITTALLLPKRDRLSRRQAIAITFFSAS